MHVQRNSCQYTDAYTQTRAHTHAHVHINRNIHLQKHVQEYSLGNHMPGLFKIISSTINGKL
jgi:hypothetical protein